MVDLNNKTIIITGGVGLLGSAFSRICAESSANVVVVDINKEKGDGLIRTLEKETGNKNLIFQKCDINNLKGIKKLITTTLKKFGKIDALVNNAYPRNKNYGRRFEGVSYEDFCENVNLHLGGYFLIIKEISKIMVKQKKGNIISLASIYGFSAPKFEVYEGTGMTTPIEYAAIKGAVINLTRYLAAYLGKYNIRVNSISPGGIFNNQPSEFVKKYSENVILGKRMAKTDDLTKVLVFLLSDDSKYITGQNIVVDGGWSL